MSNFLEIAEDSGIDALDFVVDKITESKYFDGFPIVSQMLAIIKAAKLLPNYLYAKKTCAFLDGIISENMDCDTFSQAMKELNKNPKKFEDELLFLIEKAENTEKANLLGFFTRYFALRIIDYDNFVFFVNVINNIQMKFLFELSQNYDNKTNLEGSVLYGILQSHGFVENGNGLSIEGDTVNMKITFSSRLNLFGDTLKAYFSDKNKPSITNGV